MGSQFFCRIEISDFILLSFSYMSNFYAISWKVYFNVADDQYWQKQPQEVFNKVFLKTCS